MPTELLTLIEIGTVITGPGGDQWISVHIEPCNGKVVAVFVQKKLVNELRLRAERSETGWAIDSGIAVTVVGPEVLENCLC